MILPIFGVVSSLFSSSVPYRALLLLNSSFLAIGVSTIFLSGKEGKHIRSESFYLYNAFILHSHYVDYTVTSKPAVRKENEFCLGQRERE